MPFWTQLKFFKKLNLDKKQLYFLLAFVILLPILTFATITTAIRIKGRASEPLFSGQVYFRTTTDEPFDLCPGYNCKALAECPEEDRLPKFACPFGDLVCCKEEGKPCPFECKKPEDCDIVAWTNEYTCPEGYVCCITEGPTPTITPTPGGPTPTPTLTPTSTPSETCFKPCISDGSCESNLKCISVGGRMLCHNPCCTGESTCNCSNYGGCYEKPRNWSCDLGACDEGLEDYSPPGSPGAHDCVNPECISDTDCDCNSPPRTDCGQVCEDLGFGTSRYHDCSLSCTHEYEHDTGEYYCDQGGGNYAMAHCCCWAIPTPTPGACNKFCQENTQCLSNYCHLTDSDGKFKAGYCRNLQCPQRTDCDCTPGTCTLSCTPEGYTYQAICRASSALPPGGRYQRSCSYSWGDGTTTNARSTACESAFHIYRQSGTYNITYKDNYYNATCSSSVRVGAP